MIDTALFHVGVYDIEPRKPPSPRAHAPRAGGFVFSQGDDALVVRIPAAHFTSFVTQIDRTYDLLHRQMEAHHPWRRSPGCLSGHSVRGRQGSNS